MSKRKLLSEVASGSAGEVKINRVFLNNIYGNTADELVGKLALGPTLLDITKGLKHVAQKRNDEDMKLFKYTIMLYISRGAINNAVQFLEIESKLPQEEIIEILFEHLKYKLPDGKRLNKRKKAGIFSERKYFGTDGDLHWLQILGDHAYIYIGESDGIHYKNSFIGAIDFIFRKNPENKQDICSIM